MKKILLLMVSISMIATLMSCGTTRFADKRVEEELQIIEIMTDVSAGADRHDWTRVRDAMADKITTDYTGLWGGEPVTQSADDLVAGWAAFLPGFDITQHMITGHTVSFVDTQTATGQSDFQATHRIGEDYWVLGGKYEYSFIRKEGRWLLSSLTMIPSWETGDRGLTAVAGERAQAMALNTRINLQNTPEIDGVSHREISFDSNGTTLRGVLYLPEEGNDPYPGVVVTGAWTTVKEQMPGTYARELAARGFAALTFDFTGWGESDGEIRFKEDPVVKTADIQAAARFLTTLKEIDADEISGVGICASSGYMADAVADSPVLGRVAVIAAWLHTPEMAEQIYGGPESTAKLINMSREAEGKEQFMVAASATDSASLMYQAPYYTEEDRGLIAAYDNKFNVSSWEPWLTYDGQASADRLTDPILIICSEAAALPAGAHAYAERTKAPVTELWLEDVNQFDFYDRADVVKQSTDALVDFLSM